MTLIKENLKTKGQAYYPAKTVAETAMRVKCDYTQNVDGTIHNIENGAIYCGSTYIGNFSAYREIAQENYTEELKVNLTNVSADHIADAGSLIQSLLTEIVESE